MSSTTPTLRIRLFGPVQIEHDGTPVQKLGSQKSLALLAYLIRHPQEHSRNKLAALLWIDQPSSKARSNLRWALNNLSKLLPNCFNATRQTITFAPVDDLWMDLEHFSTLSNAQVDTAEIDAVAQHVDLYRGEFLEGLTLDDCPDLEMWLFQEREYWRRQVTELLELLATHAIDQLDYSRAEECTNRLLALEPWREETHRQRIWLLAITGQRTAALAHFETCRQILATELAVDPSPETIALYEQVRDGKLAPLIPVTAQPQATSPSSIAPLPTDPRLPSPNVQLPTPESQTIDWGEAPLAEEFYGREAECTTLTTWLVEERSRMVLIVGMGGMGKTTLVARMARDLVGHFDAVSWRSLANAPAVDDIMRTWIQTFSGQRLLEWPEEIDEQIRLLLRHLRERRYLLILDNFESVLQDNGRAGDYRSGYEGYQQLIQAIGNGSHQSSLLITSREQPRDLVNLATTTGSVQFLELRGLDLNAGRSLLAERGLVDSLGTEVALVMRTSGSPLALKLVTETIRDLFNGDISAFLMDETFIFDDVRDVLDQQFQRLSSLEQAILLWLVIEREERTLADLQAALTPPAPKHTFLEAVRSLERRSLLEKGDTGFTLQNVVTEYVTTYLIDVICQEIGQTKPLLLRTHALCKAMSKDYIRSSQINLILLPILEQLENRWGRAGLESKLRQLIEQFRVDANQTVDGESANSETESRGAVGQWNNGQPWEDHYGGGNLLNLLIALEVDLRGWDFSQLPIRQAYLRQVSLQATNFQGASFAQTAFADTFGLVHAVVFHPSGQELAATAEEEIRFWREPDGQRSGVLRGHTDDVWSIAYNEDGTLLVSGSWDQTLRLWDLTTQKSIRTFSGHTKGVVAVAFSPDATMIVSGSYDHTIRIWDTEDGDCLQLLEGHTEWVWGVAFSPDGGLVASASGDQTVRLWQIRTGTELARLEGHTDQVWSVAFSPDGRYLASGGNDGLVLLWDMRSRSVVQTFRGHTNWVRSVAFTPDGTVLASGSNDGTVRLWSIVTGQPLQTLRGHRNAVNTVAMSRSGCHLASGSNDQRIRIWDLTTGETAQLIHGYTNWVRSVAISPDGNGLVSGGDDGIARLWVAPSAYSISREEFHPHTDMSPKFTEEAITHFSGHTQMVRSLTLNHDGTRLATASADCTVRLWDVKTSNVEHVLQGHTNWVSSVVWGNVADGSKTMARSQPGAWVLSSSWDGTVRLWNANSGTLQRIFQGHSRAVYCAIFHPNGHIIASGSGDQTIRFWQAQTGKIISVLEGHSDDVRTLAFSGDGRWLVSGGEDGTVRVWEERGDGRRETGDRRCKVGDGRQDAGDTEIRRQETVGYRLVQVWEEHPRGVRAVAVTRDGTLVAAGSDDGTISIWNRVTGKRLHHLADHIGVVWTVAFSPDGRFLASGSSDATIKLWHSESGKLEQTLHLPGPYAGMDIAQARGLTTAQRETLKLLGATDMLSTAELARRESESQPNSKLSRQIEEQTDALSYPSHGSTQNIPHNLPRERTPLVGRDAALAQVQELLIDGNRPLITLLGEGGVGKTRLALAIARALVTGDDLSARRSVQHRYADGIWYVPLAGIDGGADADPQAIETALVIAIADALQMRFAGPDRPTTQLIDYLRNKELLLLLDNFEHLLDAALLLSDILDEASRVQMLVTSRTPLDLQEEWRMPIWGLPVPEDDPDALAQDTLETISTYGSIALFLQLAQRTAPDFILNRENCDAVAEICRYVHGLPLAIELATAALDHLSCQELAATLTNFMAETDPTVRMTSRKRGLDLLQTSIRNMPKRHRTIRSVFAYSWQLLSAQEQRAATQLALFRGGCDRNAALAVSNQRVTVLTALVNKSILQRDANGRYTMHELLRQFCLEQLDHTSEQGLSTTTRERHTRYYLSLLHNSAAAIKGYEPQPQLGELRRELENIRQAWQWAVRTGSWELLQHAISSLAHFYQVTGLLSTGHNAMQEVITALRSLISVAPGSPTIPTDLTDSTPLSPTELFIQALIEDAHCCNAQADYDAAMICVTEALALLDHSPSTRQRAAAELRWGEALWYQGDIEPAQLHLEQALMLIHEDDKSTRTTRAEIEADVLCLLGFIAVRKGDYTMAIDSYTQSHALSETVVDGYRVGRALYSLGTTYRNQARYDEARHYLEQSLAIARQTGNRHSESSVLNTLGDIDLYEGDYSTARSHYALVARFAQQVGDRRSSSIAQTNLGIVARDLGDYPAAEQYFQQSLVTARAIGFQRGEGWNLCCLSLLHHQQQAHQRALHHAQQALRLFEQLGDRLGQAFAQTNLGRAYSGLQQWKQALTAYQAGLALRQTLEQPHLAIEVTAGIAKALGEMGKRHLAMEKVEVILAYLESNTLDGTEVPATLYWNCYQLLLAESDQRATAVRRGAQSFLQRRLALLSDATDQDAFAQKITIHRQFLYDEATLM